MTTESKTLTQEVLAEFLGTCVLILFGAGVVAQTVLSGGAAGNQVTINIAWGLGVVMGCYVSAGVSGAHLNPAVSIALAVHRDFPWRKVLPYSVAQVAGAFVGALIVYVTYHEALAAFDGGVRQVLGPQGTAGIFATYPKPYLSTFPGGFIDQVVGTAILVGVIFGIVDKRHGVPSGLGPLARGPARRGHRDGVRRQQRLRDQPGPRLRPPPVHVHCRLGKRSLPCRQHVVVGAHRGPRARRHPGRLDLRPLRRQAIKGRRGHVFHSSISQDLTPFGGGQVLRNAIKKDVTPSW